MAVLAAALAGCAAPSSRAHPAPGLAGAVERLEARVAARELAAAEEERFLRLAAAGCAEACLVGVERLTVRAGALECRCARPNVGVHQESVESMEGARGKGPRRLHASDSSDLLNEPGGVGESDVAAAGLSSGGGSSR